MRTIFAVNSDTHFGSKVALCPPAVTDDDGGTYRASPEQLWIWDWWIEYWKSVKKLLKRGDKLYLGFVGDLGDGDHHDTSQIISRNPATMHKITIQGLQPALDLHPSEMFFVRGTPAHAGEAGCFEELVAADLGATKLGNNYSRYHWLIKASGVTTDLAHYSSGGREYHTRANAANKVAARIMAMSAENGTKPPQIAFRAHRHIPSDSYDNYPVRAIILPSWQLSTSYANSFAPGDLLPIGGCIMICEDGNYEIKKFYKKPENEEIWQESR